MIIIIRSFVGSHSPQWTNYNGFFITVCSVLFISINLFNTKGILCNCFAIYWSELKFNLIEYHHRQFGHYQIRISMTRFFFTIVWLVSQHIAIYTAIRYISSYFSGHRFQFHFLLRLRSQWGLSSSTSWNFLLSPGVALNMLVMTCMDCHDNACQRMPGRLIAYTL